MKTTLLQVLPACSLLLLCGCVNVPAQPDPAYAPAAPVVAPPPEARNGAIYQAGYAVSLFEDQRARRVGDLLTVQLVETTIASKEAKTNSKRENTTTTVNPTIFGSTPQFDVPGIVPLASNRNNTLANSLSSTNDFKGTGDSSQKNSLTGTITVTVAEVMPNGYLMVRGEKLLTLNQGNESVRISGIVRPTDIRPDNSVLSTQIGNAQISYDGKGQVADANGAGWLARFFLSALWPF